MRAAKRSSTDRILEGVRVRREALYDAMCQLEAALTAPNARWPMRLRVALHVLRDVIHDHVRDTEAQDGLFEEIAHRTPRLLHAVGVLRRHHQALRDQVTAAIALLDREPPVDVTEIREAGTLLLADLARHRQRGSDLIYESYSVDVGGQG